MIVEPERYLENFAEATTAAPVAAGGHRHRRRLGDLRG
jgi:hypothetical protein